MKPNNVIFQHNHKARYEKLDIRMAMTILYPIFLSKVIHPHNRCSVLSIKGKHSHASDEKSIENSGKRLVISYR